MITVATILTDGHYRQLETYLTATDQSTKVQLIPYDKNGYDVKSIKYILVSTPIFFQDMKKYISISKFWVKYCKIYFPDITVIAVGYNSNSNPPHSNYIDILQLEGDFMLYLERAYKSSEYTRENTSVFDNMALKSSYKENWLDEIERGRQIELLLQVFLDGHHGESLFKYLTQLRVSLENAYSALNPTSPFSSILSSLRTKNNRKSLEQIKVRWSNYKAVFKYLPVSIEVEVDQIIEELKILLFPRSTITRKTFEAENYNKKAARLRNIFIDSIDIFK